MSHPTTPEKHYIILPKGTETIGAGDLISRIVDLITPPEYEKAGIVVGNVLKTCPDGTEKELTNAERLIFEKLVGYPENSNWFEQGLSPETWDGLLDNFVKNRKRKENKSLAVDWTPTPKFFDRGAMFAAARIKDRKDFNALLRQRVSNGEIIATDRRGLPTKTLAYDTVLTIEEAQKLAPTKFHLEIDTGDYLVLFEPICDLAHMLAQDHQEGLTEESAEENLMRTNGKINGYDPVYNVIFNEARKLEKQIEAAWLNGAIKFYDFTTVLPTEYEEGVLVRKQEVIQALKHGAHLTRSTPTEKTHETMGSETQSKPKLMRDQIEAIVKSLRELGYDPLAYPAGGGGKKGARSDVRKAIGKSVLFERASSFDNAWQQAINLEDIKPSNNTKPE